VDRLAKTRAELRLGVLILFLRAQNERYYRILEACSGDEDAATWIFATVLRAEGWRFE